MAIRDAWPLKEMGLWQRGPRGCLGFRGYGSTGASWQGEKNLGRVAELGFFSPGAPRGGHVPHTTPDS